MNKVRCAIYTRKSSEEGLEQDFNSLDAQREACGAYVMSQASEGWNLLPDHYDDGGISGGTLERPALQRLLADIGAGRIDIVVVYKVDRLTRSLLDFSKLVEAFDKAGTSFVSVTQSFNTTTSMGRLTLNMLLSFAQFEREVTAERIRDKIAASKAKGMWMGGVAPLGYEPNGRSLAIVEEHAKLIRHIYEVYLDLGSVRLLLEWLDAEGIRLPRRRTATGRDLGGRRFSRGQLYKILSNPIYVGDIPHRDKVYQGQHSGIIAREMWDRVQALLNDHTQGDGKRTREPNRSLLAGIIVDASGESMYATHATKKNVRYRYYVSRSLQTGDGDRLSGMRLPAREIEAVVKEQVAQVFDDPLLLTSRLSETISPGILNRVSECCRTAAFELRSRTGGPLRNLLSSIRVDEGSLDIELAPHKICALLDLESNAASAMPISVSVAFRLTRTGRAVRLVQGDGSRAGSEVDTPLIKLLALAHKWWGMLAEGELDATKLSEREGVCRSYLCRVVKVAFLAPQIVDAVLEGRQHGELEAGLLRAVDTVPWRWEEQAAKFLPSS